ncbi:MAG TPA: glycosyltransferase family 2 protein [Flavisolibacter sp.]|nr:glycosyltransferase family 2 protein [Flavisolibacter sp.]
MNPSFTIAIPVYERLFGFEEALQSARAVDGCTEILVADNHSSHNGFEKICAAQNDPRIRYVRHDQNYGVYGNDNKCAQLATGEFISILGGDDIIAPDIYERFLKAYREMPQVDVFFGPYTTFTDTIEKAVIERPYPDGPVSSRQFLEDAVDLGMRFHVLCVARRERVVRSPFVTEPYCCSNDLHWIYTHASQLNLYAHHRPLSYWRLHSAQDSAVYGDKRYDVFPFIYASISEQLQKMGSPKAKEAYQRAERVILSLLVNDKVKNGFWRKRFSGPEADSNIFLAKAREIIDRNWLLSSLFRSQTTWPVYYNLGRTYRKLKPMEGM